MKTGIALLAAFLCLSLYGQGTSGQITGVVTDASAVAIPGAKLTLSPRVGQMALKLLF